MPFSALDHLSQLLPSWGTNFSQEEWAQAQTMVMWPQWTGLRECSPRKMAVVQERPFVEARARCGMHSLVISPDSSSSLSKFNV